MSRVRLLAFGGLLAAGLLGTVPAIVPTSSSTVSARRGDASMRWPIRFEPNRGQSSRPAAFLGATEGRRWRFRLGGVEIDEAHRDDGASIRMTWAESSPLRLSPLEPLPLRTRYSLGTEPPRHCDVPTFGALRYHRVYEGVDVIFYGRGGRLVYDYLVAPGADPGTIRIRFEGAPELRVAADGGLHIAADTGETLALAAPAAFEEGGSARRAVPVRYRLDPQQAEVAFEVGPRDPSLALVIEGRPGVTPRAGS